MPEGMITNQATQIRMANEACSYRAVTVRSGDTDPYRPSAPPAAAGVSP